MYSTNQNLCQLKERKACYEKTKKRWHDEELDTQIGKTSAVMRALQYSVVMKRELSKKEKLSVFVPILTYGHESWVMEIFAKN